MEEIKLELLYGFAELTNDSYPTNLAKQSSLFFIDFMIENKDKNIDWIELKQLIDNYKP